MTPAPPPSPTDDIDLNDVLNDDASGNEGLDSESVDADFEQELEDLFSDDLEEDSTGAEGSSGTDDEPVVLDDIATEGDDEPRRKVTTEPLEAALHLLDGSGRAAAVSLDADLDFLVCHGAP